MLLEEAGWFGRRRSRCTPAMPARRGVDARAPALYRERAFRALPAPLREKYSIQLDGGLACRPRRLQSRITSWSRRQPARPRRGGAVRAGAQSSSAATCSSISLAGAMRSVVEHVRARRCRSPAYLCVGASESLLHATTAFELEEIGGAFVYVKR